MSSVIKNAGIDLLEFKSTCGIETPGFELSGNLIQYNELDIFDPTTGPIPFVFNKRTGVLDIDVSIGAFGESMIDISGKGPARDIDTLVQYLGGSHLVEELGDNFKNYIRAWRDGSIDVDSEIQIYKKPTITKIAVLNPGLGTVYGQDIYPAITRGGVVTNAPDNTFNMSDQHAYTSYVFKTPLVFTIVEGGNTRYVIFQSDNGED